MSRIPLICPRCGRLQRVVPGGPERPARVVHDDTGREACTPADATVEKPAPPAHAGD
ncbi:hypothetical protein [Kitasatospora sp. McL0602]|uniref:hypothetical protein n=1 Tax=Kitasatospora sp. McL0602 TaxID=3439530 RepID=UPI003F88F923